MPPIKSRTIDTHSLWVSIVLLFIKCVRVISFIFAFLTSFHGPTVSGLTALRRFMC